MLKVFEKSCFGNYLNCSSDYVFNASLFHAIMAKEIRVEGVGEYELWFGIGEARLGFLNESFA